jgi:hypothetical protein
VSQNHSLLRGCAIVTHRLHRIVINHVPFCSEHDGADRVITIDEMHNRAERDRDAALLAERLQ